MPDYKICTECNEEFVPKGNNQKRCDKCRSLEPAPVHKDPEHPTALVERLNTPDIERLASELMRLAGVKRMELVYDKFRVTIEAV